jgi:hypothetical protein
MEVNLYLHSFKSRSKQDYSVKNCPSPLVSVHEELPDVIVVKSHQLPNTVKPLYQEVIVGLQCAVAVLRGSKVYAPGVMGMPNGTTQHS